MDENITVRLDMIERKVDAVYKSVEKTRKYFMWTLIATLIFFLLPLLGTVVVIPIFLNSMSSMYSGLY